MVFDSVTDGVRVLYSVLAIAALALPGIGTNPEPDRVLPGHVEGRLVENARHIVPFRAEASDARTAFVADTLYRQTLAGDVLITVLPDSVSAGRVTDIENLRVPTYSWRRGRAFFWQTAPGDAGVHVVQFLVRTDGSPDTLTLIIDVEPRERRR